MNKRQQTLQAWLNNICGIPVNTLECIAGDASFRSYFRIVHQGQSYIAMDAPPDRENCHSFVAIANALRAMGVKTPTIFASDLTQGYLLLSDFGDKTFLKELTLENANPLYQSALDTLSILQTCHTVEDWSIPLFTAQFMRQEMDWFREWYVMRYLEVTEQESKILNPFFDWLTDTVSQQPYVFMHRDYHSANLMKLPDNQVGVLDFQDAFFGPVTYDLASLLRDCYVAWPDDLVNEWALSYLDRLSLAVSADQFLYWFDCMSMQRHLKALMTFSRKYKRDDNKNYLQHIPRTLHYLLKISERYPESKALHHFLQAIPACVP